MYVCVYVCMYVCVCVCVCMYVCVCMCVCPLQQAIDERNEILKAIPIAVRNTPLESIVKRCLESEWNQIISSSAVLALFEGTQYVCL